MFKTSHTSSNNNKRVGTCKKSNKHHSFEDRKKMYKEKLNTLADCTGACYNIETLRLHNILVTKFYENEHGRVQICHQKRMNIKQLEDYVENEWKHSSYSVDSYTDGLHNTKSLIHMEDK